VASNKLRESLPVMLILLLAIPGSLAIAQSSEHENHGSDDDKHKNHQGAITYTGDGAERSTTVLGGALGTQTVSEVLVGLFVLQASSPDRLKDGGSGPTHMFNVTFTDEESQDLLAEAKGTITVTGSDGSQQSGEMQPFRKHFQAGFRLEHPGDYLIKVAFESGDRKGATEAYPFNYVRKPAPEESKDGEDEHAHH
jgi:hypothetical protein